MYLHFHPFFYMFKVMPNVLEDFLQKAFISMTGSLTHFFIFDSLGSTGFSWLVVKEYNHYWIIVNITATHSQSVLGAGGHSLALWLHGRWIGCGSGPAEVQWPNHISQFYCDSRLCEDWPAQILESVVQVTKCIHSLCGYLTIPFGLILISYVWIVVIILAVLAVVSKRQAHTHGPPT